MKSINKDQAINILSDNYRSAEFLNDAFRNFADPITIADLVKTPNSNFETLQDICRLGLLSDDELKYVILKVVGRVIKELSDYGKDLFNDITIRIMDSHAHCDNNILEETQFRVNQLSNAYANLNSIITNIRQNGIEIETIKLLHSTLLNLNKAYQYTPVPLFGLIYSNAWKYCYDILLTIAKGL